MSLTHFLFAWFAFAPQDSIPASVRPFVLDGTHVIALDSVDLNGDGLRDYVLILEKEKASPTDKEIDEAQRPLLVLVQQKSGVLAVAARNDRLVYCASCGGVFGDPFASLEVKKNRFVVRHYGGSNWRWTADYSFAWSRLHRSWELVRVEETSFHTSSPDKVTRHVAVPPRNFGRIALADFDPDHWKGVGAR
jgi:hypothetical protein